MVPRIIPSRGILLSTLCMIPLWSQAFGQERPAEGAKPFNTPVAQDQAGSQEIVVTANRVTQRLTDVGVAVAVLDSQALETRNVTSAVDLQNVVPGLSVSTSGFATPIYSLRGVGVNEPSIASGSSVAVYTDEVAYTLPVMTRGAVLDLERVEVVKGPQGTLYGQNATGGAINYIAAKPTDVFHAGVTGTYGRYNQTALESYISGPLADGLKARLAFRVDRQFDGWQESVSRPGDRLGQTRKVAGRLIVQADPTSALRLTFNANGWVDRSDTQATQLVQFVGQSGNGLNPNGTPAGLPQVVTAPAILPPANQADRRTLPYPESPRGADWNRFDRFRADDWFWQGSVRGDLDVADRVTLTSITAYMRTRIRSNQDNDGIGTSLLSGATLGRDVNNGKFFNDGETRTFNQELRLTAITDAFTFIVGANYLNERVTDILKLSATDFPPTNNLPGGGFANTNTGGTHRVDSYGVFGNIDLKLTEQLSIAGGVRISKEKRRFAGCAADSGDGRAANVFNTLYRLTGTPRAIQSGQCYSVNSPGSPGLFTSTLTQDNVPWNVNVNFKPTVRSLLYGRISKGFKSGNYPTILTNNNGSFLPVRQESLLAYEVGAKVDVRRFLSVEAALFYYDYSDKQQRGREDTGPLFGLVAKQVNVPKSRIQGAELSLSLRPVEGLILAAAGSYLDSKIQTYVGYNIDGGFGDQSGGPIPFVSKENVNLDVNYERPITDTLAIFMGGNMAYRSKSVAQINAAPVWDLNAYTTYDAQLGLSSDRDGWRVWIWGKNLGDELYWTNVIKASEVITRFTNMGRTYGLTAAFKM
ncbi:TonB-dependent receptor [Sphingomonadaceae bacterium jetA1]|uniref:TonB-dependent receptor n=1 Tax=Facivitalis istanbulensis TaxID=3075838 RepID=UPI00348AA7BB